ncbi:unnamed protein product [Phytomonas sp. Hart1]|nr:unnamed protein product [Phytomonas sp. Hart1]|eukprot:CCW68344.1 unnamed protein product [Phytomonas sp. isolate Hart1]
MDKKKGVEDVEKRHRHTNRQYQNYPQTLFIFLGKYSTGSSMNEFWQTTKWVQREQR